VFFDSAPAEGRRNGVICLSRWSLAISLVLLIMMSLLSVVGVNSQPVPPGAVEEAKRIHQRWLEKESEDEDFVRKAWELGESDPRLKESSLAEPYVLYQMKSSQLLAFENQPLENVLSFATEYSYLFPMVSGERIVGAIDVGKNEDNEGKKLFENKGEYVEYGRHFADNYLDEIVLELRRQFPENQGYSVSYLVTHGLGHYFVISAGGHAVSITAATPTAANVLSLDENGERHRYRVMSVAEASPLVREAVRVFKARRMQREETSEGDR